MNRIFIIFLSMSVSGSLLILVLMVGRPFFKDRISKRWQYYIWLVVIARLLLPFSPKVSLVGTILWQAGQVVLEHPLFEGGEDIRTEEGEEPAYQVEKENAHLLNEDLTTPVMGAEAGGGAVVWSKLWLIWLGVGAIFLIRKITIYQSFVKYIKAGCLEVSDVILLDQMAEIAEQVGVKHPVELYANSLAASPMLLGFFRPCVVLPDTNLPEKEFRYTVWHELIHDKRRDMFYKWLMQITICLHWFNPLVYWMGREMNRSCELSLDEAMIGSLDEQERKAYGDTLLHAMETGGNYGDPLASVTLGESAELLKERLKAIMNYQKYSKGMKMISVFFTILLMAGAMAAGAYASSPEPGPLSDSLDHGAYESMVSQNAVYAEQCYQDKNLLQFLRIYELLSAEEQKNWIEKCYEEDSVSFFSMLAGYMSESELESWFSRAVSDGKNSFQSVILKAAGKEQEFGELEDELEAKRLEEYQAHGITKEGMDYYDQSGQLVGILMDIRADGSFVALDMNPKGTVNIRIVRDQSEAIRKIEYMTEEEVEELLGTDYEELEDAVVWEDIYRLKKEDAPQAVQTAIASCEDGKWYVVKEGDRQFVYFNGLPCNYAYQPYI